MNLTINTPFAQQFYYHKEARYIYEIGGRWSSKTFSVLQENVKDALENKDLVIAGARKVYATIKDTLFSDFLVVIRQFGLQEGVHYKANVSPLEVKFWNGSKIIFKGMDKPDKSKGLSGVHRLILEEVNEFTELDFETIDQSIRGTGYPLKTYMMHNPLPLIPGEQYWFQKLFDPGNLKPGIPKMWYHEGLGAKVSALKTTYKHNAFVPEQQKRRLEGYKITNPGLYKLWTLGEYTQIEGVIYTNWEMIQKVPENIDFWGYGQDFGFSNDPAALLKIWGTKNEIYIQGILYKTGLTNRDLIIEYQRNNVGTHDTIVADSAEPKSIEEIYRAGYKGIIGVKKAPNYKADTIKVIQGYKMYIVEGDIDLKREIATYAYAKDKNDKPLPKPQDGNDHYMDCLTMFMRHRRRTQVQMLK